MFALRRSTLLTRQSIRQASTSSSTPGAKATDSLATVAAHASKAWKVGSETVGSALGAYKEPIFGNAAVAREVLKQVYVAEKLSPPSLAQITHTYSTFFNQASQPTFWKTLIESGEWKKYGIYAVEAYGIFKIGEMIGRRHMVGYKLEEERLEKLA